MTEPKRLALIASFAAVAALAGCGGGGGGSSAPPPVPAQRVDITESNATTVAAQAVDAASADFFGDAVGVTGVQVDTQSLRGRSVVAALGDAVRRVRGVSTAASLVVGVTASETVACTNGGSVRITVDVAVQGELSPGDSARLDFDRCRESDAMLDGRLAMRFVSVSPDLTQLTADATATALTATVGAVAQRADGTIRIAIDESVATRSLLRVTSDAFGFRRLVGGTVRTTRTLFDYDYRLETATATGQTTESFAYVASGTFPLLGEVSFAVESTAPVVTPGGAAHPASGAATVTGRNGTTLDLTVVPTGVKLDLDRAGDGSVDWSRTVTWATIEGEL